MRLIGSFYMFTQRVLDSLKSTKLPKSDRDKLSRLLKRTAKRNSVLAKGILSGLSAGGASDDDIKKFSKLLERANSKILEDKEPFSEIDKKDLKEIFRRSYVSAKAADWFASQMDELLAEEIGEFIQGKRTIGVPTKTILLEEKRPKKITV
ncbi:MAG: hypothetical protein AABX38_05550 [Candidatus Micrarchaeota archaeon]